MPGKEPEMREIYWVVVCGGFVGCVEYGSEAEAIEAAKMRTNMTGRKWTVRKIVRR